MKDWCCDTSCETEIELLLLQIGICPGLCQPANGLPRPLTAGKAAPMYLAGNMGTQPARLDRLVGMPKLVDCSLLLFVLR